MQPASVSRRYDIDNLRNLAVLLLIVFHTARLFDSDAWHAKDAGTYVWADWIVRILNEWHMPLFFVLAGMSAFYAIRAYGAGPVMRERVLRLLVPFLVGGVLFATPQAFIERAGSFMPMREKLMPFSGSLIDFFEASFGFGDYPKVSFGFYHLWFIVYLFTYAWILTPPLEAATDSRAVRAFGKGLSKGGLFLIVPPVLVILIGVFLYPNFRSTHNLKWDWANHAHFGLMFLTGWLIAAVPDLDDALFRARRVSLGLAVFTFVVWAGVRAFSLAAPDSPLDIFRQICWACGEWLWIAAFLGNARALLNRRIPYLTGFTRYAFPFYILHQTVIVALGYVLFFWQPDPVVKYLAVGVLAAGISFGGCLLFDTNAVTRFILGIKAARRPMEDTAHLIQGEAFHSAR